MNVIPSSTYPSQAVDVTVASENEAARMAAVRRYAILNKPPEGTFDRIARLAAQLFDTPISIVSIVDHDRIWFKSSHGLPGVSQLAREPGLCSSAIEGREPYVVESALEDPRTRENSLVTGAFGLRFYVGVPLATSDGCNLGTLCVVDAVPRGADPEKIDMLLSLAKIVVDELELRLSARKLESETTRRTVAEAGEAAALTLLQTDKLTGLRNRRALENDLDERYRRFAAGDVAAGGIAVIDIDGLKIVNDRRGHDVGDRLLHVFAVALAVAFPERPIYRFGGDEFVAVFEDARSEDDPELRRGVSDAVRSAREQGFPEIDASCGVARFWEVDGSPRGALRLADARMYGTKIGRRAARA